MKKNITFILAIAFASIVYGTPVFVHAASSVVLSPQNISVATDKTFSVNIFINPNGDKNYTAKVKLTYPVDTIQESSFTMASGWSPIAVANYDVVDNTNGVLVKSAGYPKPGIQTQTLFGTVTFVAKNAGDLEKIQVSADSLILDGNNKNVFDLASSSPVQVSISAPVVATKKTTPKTQTTVVQPKIQLATVVETPVVATDTSSQQTVAPITTTSTDTSSLGAAVINSGVSSSSDFAQKTGVVSFAIILIGAIYVFAWRPFKNKE